LNSHVQLPAPRQLNGVAGLLMARRSVREYAPGPLSLLEVGRLMWAGQGISHSSGKRTVPSPRGLNPLRLYLVAADVSGLKSGLYVYEPRSHVLDALGYGDLRDELYDAALEDQRWIRDCAALIVIAGNVESAESEFSDQSPDGKRGRRYIHMEAGAAAQNIALRAVEMELGTVLVGGFHDDTVRRCLEIDGEPLVMMPLGRSLK